MTRYRLLLALALSLLAAPALANDGTWGGDGSDLVPLTERRIRMAREDILLEYVPVKKYGKRWLVTARYEFHNPTDEAVTVVMGFPERFCEEEGDCGSPDNHHTFWDMKTTVDGKPVPVRVGNVSREAHDWAPELGRVHLFDVTIAPQTTVKVVHTYHHGFAGTVAGDAFLHYVTRTGALWNGPIDHARFTIRMPTRPWGIVYPETYNLTSFVTRGKGDRQVTELVFEQRNWTPTQDLDLRFDSAMTIPETGCPAAHEMHLDDAYRKPTLADARRLFGELDDATLRLCRNLPYAAKGYTFKDPDLQAHFYKPATPTTERGWLDGETQDFRHLIFLPNPEYHESQLNKVELGYIKLIQLLENDRKAKRKGK